MNKKLEYFFDISKSFLVVSACTLLIACSSDYGPNTKLAKKYQEIVKKHLKEDAKYYRISHFKQDHNIIENSNKKLVFVSYFVKIIRPKRYSNKIAEVILSDASSGFRRSLLVLKKIGDQWEIDDSDWDFLNAQKAFSKPEHTIKLIAHSGYWEVKNFKQPKVAFFSLKNPKSIKAFHLKISKRNRQAVESGGVPICSNLLKHKYKPRIIRYKKQLPLLLPQSKTVRILSISRHLIYGMYIVESNQHASALPGFVHSISINASKIGTLRVYFYRVCGNDIEYGILPLKIVSIEEYNRL